MHFPSDFVSTFYKSRHIAGDGNRETSESKTPSRACNHKT